MVGGGYLLQDNKKKLNGEYNMGFDLYGLSPKTDIPKPVVTNWEDKEQTKAYFAYQENTPGSYYRSNVWWWRAMWDYVCNVCDDILTDKDMEGGGYNDGYKISKTKAKKIASRIRKLDKQGKIMEYELEYKTHISSLQKEECAICEGTGKRQDPPNIGAGTLRCNGCKGEGKKDNWECNYPFESQIVVNFARFCEESGGFEIC